MPHARTSSEDVTASVEPAPLTLSDLTSLECAVALYASDMPSRYGWKADMKPQLEAWVMQGVQRLGLSVVQERAALWRGYKLLGRHATPEVIARHKARYPKVGRQQYAEQRATDLRWELPYSPQAEARASAAEVDGGCPCNGTGHISAFGDEDCTVGWLCPVHERETIRYHHYGPRPEDTVKVVGAQGTYTSARPATVSRDAAELWAVGA